MKIFVYPGSFDPVTYGHLDIIDRASGLCDKLIVAVLNNTQKRSMFTSEERKAFLEQAIVGRENVEIQTFSGLLVDFMKQNNADTVIRGLRAISDFETEFQMALLNKNQYPKMETIFMMTNQKYLYLSSHLVKEIACFQGEIAEYVPSFVKDELYKKFEFGGKTNGINGID